MNTADHILYAAFDTLLGVCTGFGYSEEGARAEAQAFYRELVETSDGEGRRLAERLQAMDQVAVLRITLPDVEPPLVAGRNLEEQLRMLLRREL